MISIFPDLGTPERRVPSRSLLLIFSVATLSALILISWTYLGRIAEGRDPTEGLSPLYWELPGAYFWILLFPLVYYIVRRNPLGAGTRLSSVIAIHFFFALLFSAFHIVVNILLSGLLFDAAGMAFHATNPWCPWTTTLRISWRMLFYALMVTTCYAVEFYYGVQTKKLENSSLLTRLQATRLEQLKIRIDPMFVQRTLSEVARLMQTNTTAAVETITRLGAFFRLIQKQEPEITLAQHVQALQSYFRVETESSEGRIQARIKIDKELLQLRIPGFLLQPMIHKFYRFRVGEERGGVYRLRIYIHRKNNRIRLILKDSLPWSGETEPLLTEIRKTLADNRVRSRSYQIRAGRNYIWISFVSRNNQESYSDDSASNASEANRLHFNVALWIALSVLAALYYFTRRTLTLLATGNGLTVRELTNFNIGLLLCGFSVPGILWLARKINLRSMASIFLHSVLSILSALCIICTEIFLRAPDHFTISWTHVFRSSGRIVSLPDQILVYWGVVLLANAFWNYRNFLDERIRTARLQSDLSSAQLKALEMQLHPHFLFNTLHAINGLILTNKLVAARMVTRLQHFLQMTLRSSEQHLVPFTQELKFLECYLDIQKIRFGDRLNVKMDIDPETLAMLVPQLILQPIVENAIRHGMARKLTGGEILLRARRQSGTLRIAVEDNGPGSTPGETGSQARTGVGLQNSALRLYHLYGNCQTFTYGNRSEGGFEVKMEIPLTA